MLELGSSMYACFVCAQGSRDNMSIVLVSLDSAPAQDPKAQERETALDAKLESDMRELMRQAALESPTPFLSSNDLGLPGFGFVAPNVPPRSSLSLDINVLFSRLNADSYLPNLPPKTGLACKYVRLPLPPYLLPRSPVPLSTLSYPLANHSSRCLHCLPVFLYSPSRSFALTSADYIELLLIIQLRCCLTLGHVYR